MNAGKLDRRIILQVRTRTQDGTGGIVETWAELVTAWAQLVSTEGGETEQAGAVKPTETVKLRIRWISIASETHRISWNSKIYNILHIAEEGRRDSLLLTARTINAIT